MYPVRFPEQTCTMGAEGCFDLPVCKASHPMGISYVSCWKLSPEELKMVNETGVIWLSILNSQPPVALSADEPFVPNETMEGE